ncbi:hypothetical protein RUM8411_01053 [Ruegeria meonggei]|uniref:Uncharacterized protein n=1 Tax=Ruegeria meonggei TaxID=1446476 RepID=A0A1X6YMG2_9RHOB|nr:hypothetical protein RUM8411_01053 [Ruegeria meonggei]
MLSYQKEHAVITTAPTKIVRNVFCLLDRGFQSSCISCHMFVSAMKCASVGHRPATALICVLVCGMYDDVTTHVNWAQSRPPLKSHMAQRTSSLSTSSHHQRRFLRKRPNIKPLEARPVRVAFIAHMKERTRCPMPDQSGPKRPQVNQPPIHDGLPGMCRKLWGLVDEPA